MSHKKRAPADRWIVAYKIQGHETWRFELANTIFEFQKNWNAMPHPKITIFRSWRCDRITGQVIEIV